MVLARWWTAANRDNLSSRKLVEVMADLEGASGPVTEDDFKPQPAEVDERIHQKTDMTEEVGMKRFSSQHQSFGQQITSYKFPREKQNE